MGFVPPKKISLRGSTLAHYTTWISICHNLLSRLTYRGRVNSRFHTKLPWLFGD